MNFTMSNAARFLGNREVPAAKCECGDGLGISMKCPIHWPKASVQQPLADADGPFVPAPAALQTPQKALQFITAGNAYFTIRSQKSGTRYTYRVSKSKPNPQYPQASTFVALLTGPQNTEDYSYLGMLKNNALALTRKSKMTAESKPVAAFQWVMKHLAAGTMPPLTEIWHEGRCGRCGRKLTVPESIEAGIGPECAGKVGL